MARSTKKGPFIDTHLQVKIEQMNAHACPGACIA